MKKYLLAAVFLVIIVGLIFMFYAPSSRQQGFDGNFCNSVFNAYGPGALVWQTSQPGDILWKHNNTAYYYKKVPVLAEFAYASMNNSVYICKVSMYSRSDIPFDGTPYSCSANVQYAVKKEVTGRYALIAKYIRYQNLSRMLVEYINPAFPEIYDEAVKATDSEIKSFGCV